MQFALTSRWVRALAIAVAAALAAGTALLATERNGNGIRTAAGFTGCPPGYHSLALDQDLSGIADASLQAVLNAPDVKALLSKENLGCIADKHPEPLRELAGGFDQQLAIAAAPSGKIPRNAFVRAIKQRNALLRQGQSAASRHRWTKYGNGPLRGDVKDYTSVAGYGLENLSGRITSFWFVPRNVVYASVSYGGVWKSTDLGESWKSVGDKLPTQVVGAVGFTKAGGGTLIALTGDGSFGRYSRAGAGAYYSTNDGKKWRRAKGVPSDTFAFKVAVDQANPKIVYLATGSGLFRSTDAGRSYVNVALPTGACAGKSNRVRNCLLANMVTDVTVKVPGGATDEKGGQVLAAVGWRTGSAPYKNGKPQSPNNGLYFSETGKPKSFEKLEPPGFTPQDQIGRTELGAAIGEEQDHNYVYAVVQDAALARKEVPGIDADNPATANVPTVLNGIYVSPDFGQTWTLMASAEDLQGPQTGSALTGVAQSSGYGPGVQSWYNEWIQPDPSKQVGGIPTRLLFGLEEVWMNEQTDTPQTGKSSFKVVGRYYAGSSCVFVQTGAPACPTDRDDPVDETTTTHPDQHAALIIALGQGGAKIVVGNDGGVNTQTVEAGQDFANTGWGKGAQTGLGTLLPYDATIAKDGIAYAGLQDNGTMKVADILDKDGNVVAKKQQIEIYGGDGFYVGVDPHNSNKAYEEYVYGAMNATKDGGKTWTAMSPPGLDSTTAQFSTPFALDPLDPDHLLIAGNNVDETGSGPGTASSDWAVVYKLGTAKHPGDQNAEPAEDDPVNQMSAIDLYGDNAYVGYCGVCSVLDTNNPFRSGIATNVGGKKPPKRYTSRGWHIARAKGLPTRYITAIEMVDKSPKKVFVGLGGYIQPWTPPNLLDKNRNAGGGHLYFSRDAGAHFKDVTGNLPNIPVNFLSRRGKQLIASTDVGVFITKPGTSCRRGCHWEVLGKGLPSSPVFTARVPTCDKNMVIAASYGRGIWTYRFGPKPPCPGPKVPPPPQFLGEKVAGPFDFETGPEGWTPTSTGTQNWQLQPPGNNSSQSWQVAPYTDDTSFQLVSPKFKLPARSTVKVSWAERRDTEECCDYLSVEWSSDGHVWHSAAAVAGKNPDFPNFTAVNSTFVAPAGDLFVRFRLTSDALVSSPAYTGVAVDTILLER